MYKILILCTGNSCRSQMAEGILKSFDKRLTVFSAGTHPAKEISPYTITAMMELGIDISGNKPKSVVHFINEEFDYVITVCHDANDMCPVFSGKVKHRLHIGFEDPYFFSGTEEEKLNKYREIRDQIREKFYKFYLNELLKESV